MKEVILLGDSIFDNGRYVIEDWSVKDLLAKYLNEEDVVNLIAKDGAKSKDLENQIDFNSLLDPYRDDIEDGLRGIPTNSTKETTSEYSEHVFISIGGNDALQLREIIKCNNPEDDSDVLIVEDIFKTTEEKDFSTVSPIEPSEYGGHKIAQAIAGIISKDKYVKELKLYTGNFK
ncbi:SGNH/GDSL hydrolase family protein [Thiospirochaeta perfilievii]|uniref:SGNH/GDSL hydrolase family protein n=1 Tax=Thiospirochaeta perfilievii TaxID=252967 RepID=A0A5C1Q7P4_9SPIO|nr:SGNH/GDSL hydrolase family protein [Thiospirochaeta perfilievii]QEN03407.1 SGNH/GDSL hydrolase family protein [Thiospirochaeta perfilievii]